MLDIYLLLLFEIFILLINPVEPPYFVAKP